MSWREWSPPRWMVMYGYAWALAWGIPARLPEKADAVPDDLARYLGTDLDAALVRLLAEEGRA